MEKKAETWDKVIQELTHGLDLERQEGREKAYENCVSYAEKHMSKDPMCNLFLAHAASRLGTVRVMRDVIREIVPCPESAQIHIAYDYNEGPIITGNPEGLRYLSELLEILAGAPMVGEHFHLYWDQPPLSGETYGLVAYVEDDTWFEEQAPEYYSSQEEPCHLRRELAAQQVIALQFYAPLCSSLEVRPGKVYLVSGVEKRSGDDVWTKLIRDEESRLWIFSIRDDGGSELKVALDLDDPEINFLTRDDLEEFFN